MPETANEYHILVGVDASAASDAAIHWAAGEAVMRNGRVTLMHVVPPVITAWHRSPLQANIAEWQQDNAGVVIEQGLKTFHASVTEGRQLDVKTEVRYADVVAALVEASKCASLMVVGSRGLGAIGRALMGSVSSGLVRHSHCPVAVLHEGEAPDSTLPVLAGIDGSPASEAATALAFDEASRRGVDLVALHAWSDVDVLPILGIDWRQVEVEGHEVLAERLAGWQEQYPDVTVRRRIVCDQPARWLIDESQQVQLVIVGSHGRGGFTGMLLGSVSSKVAQDAKAPAIVVRS